MNNYIEAIINDAKTGNLYHQKLLNVEKQFLRDFYKSEIFVCKELAPYQKDQWCAFVDGIDLDSADQILALNTAFEIIIYNIKNCREYVEQKSNEYIKLQVLDENLFIKRKMGCSKKEINDIRQKINDCNTSNKIVCSERREMFEDIVKDAMYIVDPDKYDILTEFNEK